MESDRELFLKEAFFLYSMRDRILRDNRLYMTPVPVQNGLAYSGPPPDWALVVNQPPLPGMPRRRCQPQRPA